MKSQQRVIVGIDLGTTFSAIAIVNAHGKAEIICDQLGNRTTPSVVFFDHDGPPLVGHNAKAMAASEPERVAQFVKRSIGNEHYLFSVDGDDQGWTAPELSALILKRLKKNAEEVLGRPVTDAVITVPAYFRDDQRAATIEAGSIAGLNVLEIINEPTAAALAYGVENMNERRRILVYDLGGGTFDVTILEIDQGHLRVIATDGNAELGGKDFDDKIIQHMLEAFEREHGLDLSDRLEVMGEWRDRAEKMKIRLSELRSVRERLTYEGKTTSIELTQDQFQGLTAELLGLTEDLVQFTLEKAGLAWSDISDVLLVGGSTRMPAVPALIERMSGRRPLRNINPDDAVALGAALKGWLLSSKLPPLPGAAPGTKDEVFGALPPPVDLIKVTDVTAHSLGIVSVKAAGGYQNSIILPKNSAIPVSKERIYTTSADNQESVAIKVTQGEDADLDFCRIVGEFVLGPLAPRPKGETRIRVILSYDKNSNVKVSAIDEGSGQSIVREISAHDIKTPDAVLQARRNRVNGTTNR